MQRLLRWTVFLCFLAACLAVAVQGLSHGQALSARQAALHLADCRLPCWIGIVPGQTRLEEAAAQVLSYFPHDQPPNTNRLSQVAWTVHVAEGGFTVYLIAPPDTGGHSLDADPIVEAIVLEPDLQDSGLTIAAAISLLGDPTAISVSSSADNKYLFTILYFDGVAMTIATDQFRGCAPLAPQSLVRSLLISTDGPEQRLTQPWRGFRSCYHAQVGTLLTR